MTVALRTATRDDIDRLMPLFVDLYKGDIGPGFRDVLDEYVCLDAHRVIVAVCEGCVVGVIAGSYRLDIDYECRAGFIDAVVVHEAHRSQGIGKRLVQDFADWAAGRDCTVLQVMNGRREFFEGLGFKEREVRFHQVPIDALRDRRSSAPDAWPSGAPMRSLRICATFCKKPRDRVSSRRGVGSYR